VSRVILLRLLVFALAGFGSGALVARSRLSPISSVGFAILLGASLGVLFEIARRLVP
jgi:hypothetical protein